MKFNALFIFFVLLAFSAFKLIYVESQNQPTGLELPVFNLPQVVFQNLTGGCGGFIDCTEYLADVLLNIGAGIIFLVLFIIALVVYIIDLVIFITELTFTGFGEGTPWYVDVLATAPFFLAIGFIFYKLGRKGDSES